MKNNIIGAPFLLLLFLLSGCNKSVEPNELAYAVALGIDKSEGGEGYLYTLQIADPMVISGGSGEEGGKEGMGGFRPLQQSLDQHFFQRFIPLYGKRLHFRRQIARIPIAEI